MLLGECEADEEPDADDAPNTAAPVDATLPDVETDGGVNSDDCNAHGDAATATSSAPQRPELLHGYNP